MEILAYHGSNAEFDKFDPSKLKESGFHFGTEKQAASRAIGPTGTVKPYNLTINKIVRKKDTGHGWFNVIKEVKRRGYDGIIYLNRFEGIPKQRFIDENGEARYKSDYLDKISDREYKKLFPEADDSYIVFSPDQIEPTAFKEWLLQHKVS